MNDHRDIIDRWPSTRAFAEDLGLPYVNVNMMRQRRSINVRHWDRVIEAAKERGIRGISLKLLASTYRPRPTVRASEAREYA
jgi:acid phosphatase class B